MHLWPRRSEYCCCDTGMRPLSSKRRHVPARNHWGSLSVQHRHCDLFHMSTLSARTPEPARPAPWSRFDCREDPFRTGFDDRFVYLSQAWQDLLDRLRRDLRSPSGLFLITGLAGTGKTTLLRKLAATLQPENPFVLFQAVPVPTLDDVLGIGRQQVGLVDEESTPGADPVSAFRHLLSHLAPERVRLLIIDEAQSLSNQLLDELRSLAEPAQDGSSLLPIILAGDPSLTLRLAQVPVDAQVRSDGHRYELTPLERSEVIALIRHRLQAAGCAKGTPFTVDAIERIADYAHGAPGTINALCRLAFFFGAEHNEMRVTASSVELAASAALLNQGASTSSRLGSLPVVPADRFEPTGGASIQRPVPLAVGEAATGPASGADRSQTPSAGVVAARPPERGVGARSATGPQGQASGDIGGQQARRRGFALAAATVAAIFGLAALVPQPFDAPWEWSRTAIPWLVLKIDTESVNSEERAANPEPSPVRPVEISAPGTPGPSVTSSGIPGGAKLAGILSQRSATPVVENPEPTLEPAAWSRDPLLAASPSEDSAGPTGSAGRVEVEEPIQTVAMPLDYGALDDAEISRLLAVAEGHFRADRLVAPRFDNALATYRKVLRADPQNSAALAGIAAIKSKVMEYAQAEAARGDLAAARRQLDKIQLIEAQGQAGISQTRSPPSPGDQLGLANSGAALPTP